MNALVTTLATLLVPGVASLVVPYFILRATGQPLLRALGAVQIAALLIAFVGAAMVVWVSFSFVRHGGGTPVPVVPPKRFVSHGLYRWVRNPMYVGALLVLLADVIYTGSLWILIYTAAGSRCMPSLSWFGTAAQEAFRCAVRNLFEGCRADTRVPGTRA
jgi:protein-S-isoprenylcysteine O-methyltransferase Ste14